MGKLLELMNVPARPAEQSAELIAGNLLAEWGDAPYAELSVILVGLRALAMVHQTHHWVAKGDPFFGDHLLFERLYNETVEEADRVAEKAVGLGGDNNVNVALQAKQVLRLVSTMGGGRTVPSNNELALKSLAFEVAFVGSVDSMIRRMQESGTATAGVENMLQGIADVHEGHVYLLKRRCSTPALGM